MDGLNNDKFILTQFQQTDEQTHYQEVDIDNSVVTKEFRISAEEDFNSDVYAELINMSTKNNCETVYSTVNKISKKKADNSNYKGELLVTKIKKCSCGKWCLRKY